MCSSKRVSGGVTDTPEVFLQRGPPALTPTPPSLLAKPVTSEGPTRDLSRGRVAGSRDTNPPSPSLLGMLRLQPACSSQCPQDVGREAVPSALPAAED